VRVSAFGHRENIIEAARRLKQLYKWALIQLMPSVAGEPIAIRNPAAIWTWDLPLGYWQVLEFVLNSVGCCFCYSSCYSIHNHLILRKFACWIAVELQSVCPTSLTYAHSTTLMSACFVTRVTQKICLLNRCGAWINISYLSHICSW
jgi:hypothetical protein